MANVLASTSLTSLDIDGHFFEDDRLLQIIRDGVAANKRKAQQRRSEKALVMSHCMLPKVLQTIVAAYL